MRIPYKGQSCIVSSPFGERILNGQKDYHRGIDLVGVDGDRQLIAPCSGRVAVSTMVPKNNDNLTWQWGNYIRIDTDEGLSVYMCHMAQRLVNVGQRVDYGTPVGIQGNTGYSFGEHCHFEVRRNGVSVNPAPFLGIENKCGVYKDVNGLAYDVNDQVLFVGNKQFSFSQSSKAIEASECLAKVTATYPIGKHPYHIVGEKVWGWVDQSDVVWAGSYKGKVTCYKLNVRSGAGIGFPIVGTLKENDIVRIVRETANGWGKIQTGNNWVNLSYIKKIEA